MGNEPHDLDWADSAVTSQATLPGFGPGTLISTTDGDLPVEWLAAGDRVLTRDDGAQPLRWIGRSAVPASRQRMLPHLRPVTVPAGYLAPDAPNHPLTVSPRHRVLVQSPDVAYYFGTEEAFAAVTHLLPVPRAEECADIVYHHLLFDRHQVIRANGVWTESLFAHEHSARLPATIRHAQTARRCLAGWEVQFLRLNQDETRVVRRRAA